MQEVMNKIVDAEQKAQEIHSNALNEAKLSQADAVRQGKELIDKARKESGEQAKDILAQAQQDVRAILDKADRDAAGKAAQLIADSRQKVLDAARFVTERIVNSV